MMQANPIPPGKLCKMRTRPKYSPAGIPPLCAFAAEAGCYGRSRYRPVYLPIEFALPPCCRFWNRRQVDSSEPDNIRQHRANPAYKLNLSKNAASLYFQAFDITRGYLKNWNLNCIEIGFACANIFFRPPSPYSGYLK